MILMIKAMKSIFVSVSVCLTGACILFLAGCATYDDSRSAVQENENVLLLREDVNRCKSRMETMEIEQQKILSEIQQLRGKGQDESAKARLDELERRITALDAARAGDRQAIIDQLSGNVAKMMGATTASKTIKPAVSSATSSNGSEHIVKEGETLSTIAGAYKVTPAAIIKANDLKNPDVLRKGQKLLIPQ